MINDIKNRISLTKAFLLQLSVIIVNFNVKYFLEQCLCTVINACKNIETEIFVVDNNSTDGSKEFFEGRFSPVIFLWNTENAGFGKANNLALQKAKGEYILFLNPDTILPEDCFEKCLTFLQHQIEMGAMGVRMIDGSGAFLKESKRGFPSPFVSLCKLTGLTALFPFSKTFARYYLGHLDQHKNHEVDVLAGAFMIIPKKVLDKTGAFDEQFFMYGEDVDLSYRIQKAGFKNMYFSECTIIHFKGESTKRGSLNYIRLFYGAMGLFVKKHNSSGDARHYHLLIQVVIWIKAVSSSIGLWLKQTINYRKEKLGAQKCLIVSDKKEFDLVRSIMQKNNIHQEIAGRINPHHLLDEDSAGNLQQLPALVIEHDVKEIIFCINGFSAKEMIVLIQQLPAGVHFRFHFAGTRSMVGSNSKDYSGDYIALGN